MAITPPATVLNSPADASSGSDATPTLDFTGTDQEGDDVRYQLQLSTKAFDAIALDTSGQVSTSATSSVTQSITVASGNNRKLMVVIANNSSGASPSAPTGVTYNGVALAKIADRNAPSGANNASIWEINGPDTGTHNLIISASASFDYIDVGWVVLQNASQSASQGDGMTKSSVTNPSVYMPCPLPGSWAISVVYPSSGSVSGVSGGTEIITGYPSAAYSGSAEDGPITHSYTGSSSTTWAIAWAAILPAYADGLINRVSGNRDNYSDNFDDNSIGDMWTSYTANGGSVSETSQQLQLTCANTTNGSWAGIVSDTPVDLRGMYVKMRLIDATGGNTYLDLTLCKSQIPSNEDYFASIGVDTGLGMLQAYKKFGGTIDTIMADEAFNATDHQYIRLREDSGMLYWEYSADDSAWTVLWSEPAPIDLSNIYIVIDDYEYNGSGNPGAHIVDSFEMGVWEGSAFANPDVGGDTDPFNSGENIQFTVQAGDALSLGTYYWRVRGKDPTGSDSYGAWSSVRSFTVTSGGGSYSQICIDTLSIAESILRSPVRTLSETASIADSISKRPLRTVSESVSIADTVRKSISRVIIESQGISDFIVKMFSRVFSDSTSVSDSSNQAKVTLKTLSDSVSVSDGILKIISRAMAETASIADSVEKKIVKTFSDSIPISDTTRKYVARAVSESISIIDSVPRSIARLISEAVSVSDSLIKRAGRNISETVSISESVFVAKVAFRILSETVSVVDSIGRSVVKVFSEIVSIADSIAAGIIRELSRFFGVLRSIYPLRQTLKSPGKSFVLNGKNTAFTIRDNPRK